MSVVVDTADVAPRERFDFWADATSNVFVPVSLRRRDTDPFTGRIWAYQLGPLNAYRVAADPSTVARTPGQIGAADNETLQLIVQVGGRCAISQGDRSSVLTAGNISAFETSRPYRIEHDEPFELLFFGVPKALLRPHIDRICRRTALAIPGDAGVGVLAVPFLRQLADGLHDGGVRSNDLDVAECLLSLVRALYLGADEAAAADGPGAASALLPRIKSYVDAHLGDHDLGPETIAAAHYISTRYLHRLFQEETDSVSGWIRARRLERARRDLLDPALASDTILTIASRWGMRSAAHFSRAFRAAYGSSPRELRGTTAHPPAA
jgi:AraC-like DNA-binding protein